MYRPLELVGFTCIFSNEIQNTKDDLDFLYAYSVYPVQFGFIALPAIIIIVRLNRYGREISPQVSAALSQQVGNLRQSLKFMSTPKKGTEEETEGVKLHLAEVEGTPKKEEPVQAVAHKHKVEKEHVVFTKSSGPGLYFAAKHVNFIVLEFLCDCIRHIFVWVLLTFPLSLRLITLNSACYQPSTELETDTTTLPMVRLRNYDESCASYSTTTSPARKLVLGFGTAGCMAFALFLMSYELYSVPARRAIAVMIAGYKPQAFFWEVLTTARTGAIILVCGETSLEQRVLYMFLIVGCFEALTIAVSPYEGNGRRALILASRAQSTVLLLTLLAGVFASPMYSSSFVALQQPASVGAIFWLVVLIMHYSVMVYVGFMMVYTEKAVVVQALIDSGAYHSFWSKYLLQPIEQICSLHCVKTKRDKETRQLVVDTSKLNDSERSFLVLALTSTVAAVLDSGDTFQAWRVEKAIVEAFDRATQARTARVRAEYERYGVLPHGIGGFMSPFRVNLRPPDIPPDTGMQGATQPDQTGVTVEELYTTLQDVNMDVRAQYPPLLKREYEEELQEGGYVEKREMILWDKNSPLDDLEYELEMNQASKKATHSDVPDYGWRETEMETRFRIESRTHNEGQHRELEKLHKTLSDLDAEILLLKKKLERQQV